MVDQTRRLCRFYSSLPNERLAVALDVLGNMIDVDGDELLDKTLIPALGLIHMRIGIPPSVILLFKPSPSFVCPG